MGFPRAWWWSFSLLASALTGQEAAPEVAEEVPVAEEVLVAEGVLRVRIEVIADGESLPRVPTADGEKSVEAFRLEGRRLAWQVGSQRCEDPEALRGLLTEISNDPRRRVPDPDRPGTTRIPPCVIEPAEACRWNDVVQTIDAARGAWFKIIHCVGVGEDPTPWLALTVTDPVRGEGEAVVPTASSRVRGELPAVFRPVLHLSQDGTVRLGEEVLVRPGEPPAVDRLAPRLAELAERGLEEAGGDEATPEAPRRSNAPLLLHADLWTPWPTIRRVVRAADRTDPLFRRIEYAVGESDFEARLQQGERF